MNDCDRMQEQISEYIDGMLDTEVSDQLLVHLSECSDCRAYYHSLTVMMDTLNTMPEEEPGDGFHDRLINRIKDELAITTAIPAQEGPLHKIGNWAKWGAGAAAVVILLLSVRFLGDLNLSRMKVYEAPLIDKMQVAHDENPIQEEMRIFQADENGESLEDLGINSIQDPLVLEAEASDSIHTDAVDLMVQDVRIVPETLYGLAEENGIDVVLILEGAIILKLTTMEQREILHRELSRLGTILETGLEPKGDQEIQEVTIRIVPEE